MYLNNNVIICQRIDMVGIELVLTRGVLKVFLFGKMKIRNGLLPHFTDSTWLCSLIALLPD